jgi:hypothetical protein
MSDNTKLTIIKAILEYHKSGFRTKSGWWLYGLFRSSSGSLSTAWIQLEKE